MKGERVIRPQLKARYNQRVVFVENHDSFSHNIVDAIRSLEAGAVSIEAIDDEVVGSLGRARFSLRTFAVVDYPKLPPITGSVTTVPGLDVVAALNQVVRAAATDDTRPLLTGVLFTHHEGSLRLIATDSYRLAIRDIPGVAPLSAETDVLVPARALVEFQRAANSLPVDAEIGITLTSSEICFIVGSTTISSRLIDGTYPSVTQLIPVGNRFQVINQT